MPENQTATHYVLANAAGVYVKDAAFFASQGGLADDWGKSWEPVIAGSLYDARNAGIKIRRQRFPDCHKTLGENGEAPESYWPEAKGA